MLIDIGWIGYGEGSVKAVNHDKNLSTWLKVDLCFDDFRQNEIEKERS